MLKPLGWNCAALGLRLKDRALQRRDQKAGKLIGVSLARQLAKLHRGFQAIRDRLAQLFVYFNQPLSDHFAVIACFGAEVADQASVPPTDSIEILDLRIDIGAQALERRQRVVAKRLLDRRADVLEIEIEYFKTEGFFRNEVIGEGSLRHSRRFNYVANARATKPALMHDAEAFGQYFLAMRRFGHQLQICTVVLKTSTAKYN
jgi:hypothetical protein